MKTKRLLVLLLSLVLACTVFAGCDGPDFMGGEEVEEGDLVVWTVDPLVGDYRLRLATDPNDRRALMTKQILDGFKEKTGVKAVLKNKGWGVDLNKELQAAVGAHTMPDVVVGEQFVKSYVDGGHFAPITLDDDCKDDIIEAGLSLGRKTNDDGKLYAVPVWTGSFALTVNLKTLRDVGILNGDNTVNADWQAKYPGINPKQPATWEDLLAVCEYIKGLSSQEAHKGKGGILMSATKDGSPWRALVYMRTAGGDFVNANGDVAVDSPENRKAFEMMRRLVKTAPANSISSSTETYMWDTYLFKDLAAYTVDGNDTLYKAETNERESDFIAVELPTFAQDGVKSNVLVGSGYYSISNDSKMKDVANQFINYLLSKEVQEMIMNVDMRVSTRKSIIAGENVQQMEKYEKMKAFLAPFSDDSYDFEGGLPQFTNNASEIWEKWDTFIGTLLKTDNDLDAAIRKAQADMYGKQHA